MNVLACVAYTRELDLPRKSWQAACEGVELVYLRGGSMDDTRRNRRWSHRDKLMLARNMAVAGDYDALLLLDDDQIIPADTLARLTAVLVGGADVAYGLTVRRDAGHHWTAALEADGDGHIVTLDDQRDLAAAVWGQVIDVAGVGPFCTLLNRRALDAMTGQMRGIHAADWYMAEDWRKAGLVQRCDTGCLVGHMIDAHTVLWPALDGDPDWWYRTEHSA